MKYEIFIEKAYEVVEQIEVFVHTNALEGAVALDHLCFKCASHEEFEQVRAMLEPNSLYLYESWISSRLIAILKLEKPIETTVGVITFIELQDQKPAGTQKGGFAHVEAYPVGVSYKDVLEMLHAKDVTVVEDQTPHHPIHEVELSPSFVFRLEQEPVIEKIKRDEL